jgi:hypothetical protein
MKQHALCLLSLLALSAGLVDAKPKTFEILGGTKIAAEVERGIPLPAIGRGVRVEVAGFFLQNRKLHYTFGFSGRPALKSVLVEDVTDRAAVTLVEDNAPVLSTVLGNGYWKGDSAGLALDRSTLPWFFARGATTKVFRFTIRMADGSPDLVLYQPAVLRGLPEKAWR